MQLITLVNINIQIHSTNYFCKETLLLETFGHTSFLALCSFYT